MARDFQDLKDGDQLEPFHINMLYREARRWRKLRATFPLSLTGAESSDAYPEIRYLGYGFTTIQLITNGSSGLHDWKEVQWNGSAYEDTGVNTNPTGSATLGDQAREMNGLNCPKGDEIFRAWRDNYGILRFMAVRCLGVSGSAIAAGGSGTVTLWSYQGGTLATAGLSVTAYNWNNLTQVAGGKNIMVTPVSGKWYVDFESC